MDLNLSDFFSTFKVSSQGLSAEKRQLAITAENIANANTTRTEEGTPYRRKHLVREMISQRQHFTNALRNASLQMKTSSGGHLLGLGARPDRLAATVSKATAATGCGGAALPDKSRDQRAVLCDLQHAAAPRLGPGNPGRSLRETSVPG